MTTNWNDLIGTNINAVLDFAEGISSKDEFRKAFSGGQTNPARQLVMERGVQESRRLARKALRRRGYSV